MTKSLHQLQQRFCLTIVLTFCLSFVAHATEPQDDAKKLEFFESKIRPVLIEHCYRCHSEAALSKGKLKGGLRVDSRQGLLVGGDSGASVVPNQSDESLLLEALRFESFEMPPEGKLSDAIIADFEKWISEGAVDPRVESASLQTPAIIDIEAARNHWAYRPIPEQTELEGAGAGTTIDTFIDNRLTLEGLNANDSADRRTLVRRAYFDLHGLPPSPSEIDQFLNDTSEDAYEKLIDRLLASQEFGRHWGRHWLDIVRFAESVTLRGLVQPNAWRYRNYVIDAFNADLPYDQFLREQIAGDLMDADSVSESQRMHIATTFLTLTDANLEDQDKEKLRMDVVDEQLDVIGKAFLAQTIGCARCHDHKFDPIPTKDYYALAGILQNSRTLETSNVSRWLDLPLPLEGEAAALFAKLESERNTLQSELDALRAKRSPKKSIADSKDLPGIVIDDEDAIFQGAWVRSAHIATFVDNGYQHDDNEMKGEKSATFPIKVSESGDYEVRMSYSPGANRSPRVNVSIWHAGGESVATVDQRRPPNIDGLFVSLGQYRFESDQPAKVEISSLNTTGHVIVDCVQLLKVSDQQNGKPQLAEKPDLSKKDVAAQIAALEAQVKELEKTFPPRELYMGVVLRDEFTDSPIHIRGNVHQHGPIVPRGFLQVVTYQTPPEISESDCGRLQLAEWISAPSNPLPARVIVNRTWHWLFGTGLVRSMDNFGLSGEVPSHPQLLDYLARSLIEKQWSLKGLIKEIVMSDAYRRSSRPQHNATVKDPDNRLLWRMNRKRLSAEVIQDSILLTSGVLDRSTGESALPSRLSADYGFKFKSQRRAVYWPLLRNSIPELIATFDGANPSLVVGKRNVSSVATQALFMMNNSWVIEQSELAAKDLLSSNADDQETLQVAFEKILGREPTNGELLSAMEFLNRTNLEEPSERLSAWTQVVQSLFSTVDFRYRY